MKFYLIKIWQWILSLFKKEEKVTPEYDEELSKNLQETLDALYDLYKEMYQS